MKILLLDKNHPLISEQLLEKIDKYEGVIIRSRIPLDARLLEKGKNLKFIARVGAGMENIDVSKAQELGIKLINSPEGNRDAVAEHCLGMLLVLMNRLFISANEVKNNVWLREENRGEEIKGKTFGLIGYGNMGKALAKRLSGFGCEVIFYDIKPNLSDGFAKQVSLKELQANADILSLHIPLNDKTHYIIDEKFISEMKKSFYFINTSRGKNVKTLALIEGIKSGKVKGACLDVLEYEKSSFENLELENDDLQYLLNSEKVIITPHIAGWTHQSKIKLAQTIVDKILVEFSK